MSGKDRLFHRALHMQTRVTIISYDLVIKFEPSIRKANFSVIICDESHYLKSVNAKRTKALTPILKKAKHCILLSGTPALSRPMELYTQISALTDIFGSLHSFGSRYCGAKKVRGQSTHFARGGQGPVSTALTHRHARRLVLRRLVCRADSDGSTKEPPTWQRSANPNTLSHMHAAPLE